MDDQSLYGKLLGELEQMKHRVSALETTEGENKRSKDDSQLNEARLQALLKLTQMAGASLEEIGAFALDSAVALTNSKIGYLAFVSPDERQLSLHAWSNQDDASEDVQRDYRLADTGMWGEAVRQRKPVFTDDYHAAGRANEFYPGGNAQVRRHMSTPVLDGDHIVLVAGVGNKEAPYDEADLRQLTLLLQAMWQLIQLRRAHDELETRVEERTAELAKANDELKRQFAERERAQDILRDSEALYSSLVENLPVHVLRKDLSGRFEFANRSFCQLLGRKLEDIIGRTDFDLFPDRLAQKFRDDDQKVLATGRMLVTVEENRNDDEMRYMEVMKSPVHDADDNITGVQVVFWDVTDRKRAEADLEHERYLLSSLMDNLPYHIYFKDSQCRFIRINRAQANYLLLAETSDALGKTDHDFFTDEHAGQAMADEVEIMRSGMPIVDKEEKETWADGHFTWALTTKIPLYDDEMRIVGTMGISRDITERKQADEALRQAKQAAEAANRAKSTFLANMSHEIRTPLNAVIGMTELVLKSTLSAQQREFLQTVRDSGEALLSVINDVLDFSKIEAGKLELDCYTFDLRESLGDTMKSFAIRAHERGLELACFLHHDVPRIVVGDYNRLRQVVINLVGNALKFTEVGEVSLEVRRESGSETEVELHFIVSDTGLGIPEAKQKTIFEMFEQADTSTTRRHGGTGLGLAIASRLIDLMRGRIWVESQSGQGSRFHFTVHLGLSSEEKLSRAEGEPAVLHGMRVLVVDDNATNRRILNEVLNSWQVSPTTVATADEALQLLLDAHRRGDRFELVITDAHMPEVDGFMLAERIKTDNEMSSTVVMMLTSGDRREDVQRCEELGIAAYLLKPIKQSELLEAIEVALGVTTPAALAKTAESLVKPPRDYHILLAEDSLVNQKLAIALLEGQGHHVRVVNNGREALAVLEKESFDIVLMDVQMPEMDGVEATTRIRTRERVTGGHVPIVAMTAHALKGDRERFLEAGMDAYIAKPIRADEFFSTIDGLLSNSPAAVTEPPREGGEAKAKFEGETASTEAPTQQPSPGDWTEALRAVRGDEQLLQIIVEAAVKEIPHVVTSLDQAVAAADAAKVQLHAHTLKGAVRYFASGTGFEQLRRLEIMGQTKDLAGSAECLAEVKIDVERLMPMLTDYLRRGAIDAKL